MRHRQHRRRYDCSYTLRNLQQLPRRDREPQPEPDLQEDPHSDVYGYLPSRLGRAIINADMQIKARTSRLPSLTSATAASATILTSPRRRSSCWRIQPSDVSRAWNGITCRHHEECATKRSFYRGEVQVKFVEQSRTGRVFSFLYLLFICIRVGCNWL